MVTILKHIPNALCIFRLAIIPLLWVMVWFVRTEVVSVYTFTVIVALGYLSDCVDGILCRKYSLSSKFGAKFDRLSDDFLTINSIGWLWVIRPELVRDYWQVILTLVVLMLVSIVVQYWREGRKIAFHLLAGKTANWAIGLFVVGTLVWGLCPYAVWLLALIVAYALLEEIILVTTARDDELDERLISMWSKKRWGSHGADEALAEGD